ncbi:bifunctional nicotinamidase/pyrazinamidase [Suttonella sp. R2A3]|uniref:bifunctional nicotinamidase/pyrazinamidase n=1 Tax=Suttonella sp. R2A3 TaxID=2908648 RepID=UPI001F41A12B|nr:bifunctional nicotinamidase/pyrazinamidase [Suttonella sp. R2A3]UJF25193.1 bifunctional nicotinamidase/pyrazinamidase [Suttonella sp. R2A3]
MLKNTTLLLVDIQNGFMPEGELPVAEGDQIVPIVNALIPDYPLVVASQDWHPSNHSSFAANHPGKHPFEQINLHGLEQVLWPIHCVAGSHSAAFHPDLDERQIAAVFRKGMNPDIDSYSAFYDNGHRQHTGLADYLRAHQISTIHIAGLAADYCVYFTIKDALAEGFNVTLHRAATRAIDPEQYKQQLSELNKHPAFSTT